jgi:hypothetical protein
MNKLIKTLFKVLPLTRLIADESPPLTTVVASSFGRKPFDRQISSRHNLSTNQLLCLP